MYKGNHQLSKNLTIVRLAAKIRPQSQGAPQGTSVGSEQKVRIGMKLSHITLLALTLIMIVMTGYSTANNQDVTAAQVPSLGSDAGSAPTHQRKFSVSSPTGSGTLKGKRCAWSGNPHEFPACEVRLILQNGTDAGWSVASVVYAV